jgi:hypothetical protein
LLYLLALHHYIRSSNLFGTVEISFEGNRGQGIEILLKDRPCILTILYTLPLRIFVSGILDSFSSDILLYTDQLSSLAHELLFSEAMREMPTGEVSYMGACVLLDAGLMGVTVTYLLLFMTSYEFVFVFGVCFVRFFYSTTQ